MCHSCHRSESQPDSPHCTAGRYGSAVPRIHRKTASQPDSQSHSSDSACADLLGWQEACKRRLDMTLHRLGKLLHEEGSSLTDGMRTACTTAETRAMLPISRADMPH